MDSIDLGHMMLFSAILRLLLLVYGEWQDVHMEVRYTDVDYIVFSDAASLVAAWRSPFERSTYRSTLHRSWGKLIFSSAGLVQHRHDIWWEQKRIHDHAYEIGPRGNKVANSESRGN